MKLFSKVAAVVCSAATLVAVGAAAISASAADLPTIYADQVYAEPGQIVDFSLRIKNNTGYAGSGIGLYYDERIEPQGVSDLDIQGTRGEASTGLAGSLLCNTKKLRVGWTSSGTSDNTTDGAIYTVRFKVPDDAKPGDTYEMNVVVTMFCTSKSVDLDYEAVAGWIKIKDVTTSETTVETTAETTESETTESETTKSETTVSETTVSSSEDSTSEKTETTVSSSENTGDSTETTIDTTDNTAEPGTETSSESQPADSTESTDNGGNGNQGGNDQPGVKTGDAGVALAVAGLLTAAGAAVVIRRKH